MTITFSITVYLEKSHNKNSKTFKSIPKIIPLTQGSIVADVVPYNITLVFPFLAAAFPSLQFPLFFFFVFWVT